MAQGLGLRVQGLGLRVQGLGLRVQGLGLSHDVFALQGHTDKSLFKTDFHPMFHVFHAVVLQIMAHFVLEIILPHLIILRDTRASQLIGMLLQKPS